MDDDATTIRTESCPHVSVRRDATPGVLVASARPDSVHSDRTALGDEFVVGRSAESNLTVRDGRISKQHFRIFKQGPHFVVEDLGSTNGTRVGGVKVNEPTPLKDQAVIRAGSLLLIFHEDASDMLLPPPPERYGFVGKFHSARILMQLREASIASRHVLIAGPSGSGKELAAGAFAIMISAPEGMLAHNCALFSSEEEATATLFGVEKRAFSNVDARPGLVERAGGAVLFLDEVHNLPHRIQRSLLRVIEGGRFNRIGGADELKANVRFVLASNMTPPTYGLADDLLARLRIVRLPPLSERLADIPLIFRVLLQRAFGAHDIDVKAQELLGPQHLEELCLHGFRRSNVRGLVDLSERIATRVAVGTAPAEAVDKVLGEFLSEETTENPVSSHPPSRSLGKQPRGAARSPDSTGAGSSSGSSLYEQNKELIVELLDECDGNLAAAERALKARGFTCSRKSLRHYADLWGIRRKRNY
jgi:DNA-binding NtrC family response regulator